MSRWITEKGEGNVKVNLLSFIPDADIFCARIARYANVEEDWDNLIMKIPKDGWTPFLRRVLKMGHTSILEHAVFTFEVSEVSRVLTHQLVRHRIASYLQKSFRKVRPKSVIIPRSAADAAEGDYLKSFRNIYRKNVPLEDARYLAPMGSQTSIIVTMNARELREVFFPLRTKKPAQWEIRCLANMMLREVKKYAPVIFEEFEVDEKLLEEYNL